ncbi:DEAD/DEAH box helicase [Brachybacterium squillarum]|uniref:DEAD/DEAH box helicase n=1 Tax=Brachybacterium squillarum TaxID=661979 RepID=UPI0002629E1D|nr:DEAD/DEAH box helicase [Brachybacterium squillarum]
MSETIPTEEAASASAAVEQSSGDTLTTAGAEAPAEPAKQPVVSETFADFDVREDIVEALSSKGIIHPFPIQSMTLPVALKGRDIIGQAKTGTGKTLGFGIPLLQSTVAPGEDNPTGRVIGKPQALVVLPTRELAVQVAEDLQDASAKRPVRILTVYGGRAYEPQIEALEKGVDVVVGTPGRLIDLMRQKYLDLSQVRTAVLDEADEMLDLGFLEDIEKLLRAVPEKRQTMLFSATMPGPILALARRFMTQPTHIRAHDPGDVSRTKADIKQVVYRAHQLDKIEVLARVLQSRGRGLTIVFMRTKRQADRVAEDLQKRGFAAAPLHGDLGQGAREQALRAFRNGKVDVLVATDVAARGIDVDDVTHVINWNSPDDDKTYLHRTGRTGRAGKKGTAVTFVDWEDLARWALIARQLGLESTEAVETYSTSPHLYADLDIPEGTKGTLPKAQRTRAGLEAEEVEDLGGPEGPRDRGSRGGDRGGRSGDRGGRGGRGGERSGGGGRGPRREERADSEAGSDAGEERPRRNRSRTRTRRVNGEVVDGEQGSGPAQQSGTSEQGGEGEAPKRRRRSRGGRGRRRSGQGEGGTGPAADSSGE